MNFTKLTLTFIIFFITGCSTTGGTIGGLIPAPKFMEGSIDKKTYYSKDKDFSISIPHGDGSYEFSHMNVKEQYGDFEAYISFGPAAFDQSIYRLNVGRKVTPESRNIVFEDVLEEMIDNYKHQIEKGYQSKPALEKRKAVLVNGKKSYYFSLRQEVPSGILINNMPATLHHEGIATEYESLVAIVWVQKMTGVVTTKQSSLTAIAFAESFSIAPRKLKGTVEGDTYFSPEGAFSVQLPYPPSASKEDKYDWAHAEVNETKDRGLLGIIFGPAALDFNMYHAILIRAPMKQPKSEYVSDVLSKRAQFRNGEYSQKEKLKFTLNGKDCFYAVYESDDAYLVTSITDNNDSFYVVEVDVSKKSKRGSPTLEQLISRQWDKFNNILKSFIVLDSKYEIESM